MPRGALLQPYHLIKVLSGIKDSISSLLPFQRTKLLVALLLDKMLVHVLHRIDN